MTSTPLSSAATTKADAPGRPPPVRKVRIGQREVVTRGLAPSFWNDVFHAAMTATWPRFLVGLGLAFVATNAAFALLYALAPDSVANAHGRVVQLFFFSVETLTTVGYGEMYPQTNYGHLVVSIETFAGLFYTASMLGLIFARVSRPTARLLFTDVLTVAPNEGKQTLFVRVANARLNVISTARAELWLLSSYRTAEGILFRRFVELKLVRAENPTFALSWTIFHTIDETSPLYGLSRDELVADDASFIIVISGHDETFAQTVQARRTYSAADVLWDHRFADILSIADDGTTVLDYHRFQDVEPAESAR